MQKLRLAAVAATLLLAIGAAGAQGQSNRTVPHECRKFNPDSVHVAGNAQGYWLAGDDGRITNVKGSRVETRLAVYIIRYYRMDEFCGVGRGNSALTYFLVNGRAPEGRSPSEDCLWFDPLGSQLLELDGYWTLVDRNDTALSLGRDKGAALEAVDTIRRKNFSEICFVGRPGAAMVYFIR